MISLLLRNLFFTILQPGIVAGLIPYIILRSGGVDLLPETFGASQFIGGLLMALGSVVAIACILRFAAEGKGTLSPLDPTKKLVVHGLYRYSRNPMYVGVMLLLIGEAIFWWSPRLLVYSAAVFIAFNLFIFLHEEPRLRREFGADYDGYRSEVRRWI